MATYTSNYNLEKPDVTDPFGDFRAGYNSNMDIIDQNLGGGGGGGGHTIIDPNGSDMAQRAGLQFTGSCSVTDDSVNDKTVVNISGGGGNVYGAFIDTDRIIQSATTISGVTTASYTATEDCVVCASVVADYDKASEVKIDNVRVWRNYNGSGGQIANALNVYLRKGQIIAITNGSTSYSGSYTVYGIKQGTSGIFAPVIYSDTERKIGIWRDNKPLYKKTIPFSFTPSSNDFSYTIETLSNDIVVQRIESDRFLCDGSVFKEVIYPPSTLFYRYAVNEATKQLEIRVWNRNGKAISGAVTIYYTKTTDTAGSGDWNTDGVPTVHYDTSEKVIGTWVTGKPLYQKTFNISSAIPQNTTYVVGDITNFDLVEVHGIALLGTGAGFNMPYYNSANEQAQLWWSSNELKIFQKGYTITGAVVTIRYTKTTD